MVALKLPLGDNDIETLTEFDGVLKDDGESETVDVGEFDGNGQIDIFITLGVNSGVPVTSATVFVVTSENVEVKVGVFVFDSVVSLERLCISETLDERVTAIDVVNETVGEGEAD